MNSVAILNTILKTAFFQLLLVAALTVSAPPVLADDSGEARLPENAASLKDLLKIVKKTYPGQILEVEIEQETIADRKIWVYEVKLLTRQGRVYELEYDAMTLEFIRTEN